MKLNETLSIMITLIYSVRTSIIILISVRLPETSYHLFFCHYSPDSHTIHIMS